VLTDSVVQEAVLPTSVGTLGRVLSVVDWAAVSKGNPEAWLYFYEEFLAEYDNALRRQTGSYYTPVEVVKPMTRMVNEALRDRFGFTDGSVNSAVTLVDPAMGTETFLLEILRSLAATVSEDQGAGAVPAAVDAALSRIIGFGIQLGPFAVAQLRILAEIAELGLAAAPADGLQTYVTNTLDNPFVEDESLGMWHEPIARSRREANRIKKTGRSWLSSATRHTRNARTARAPGSSQALQRRASWHLWPGSSRPPTGVWVLTSSTSTTSMSTSGGGRHGKSSTRPSGSIGTKIGGCGATSIPVR
jgi:hypothetical protein